MRLVELGDDDVDVVERAPTRQERIDTLLALVQEYQRAHPDVPPFRRVDGVAEDMLERERHTLREAAKRKGWRLETKIVGKMTRYGALDCLYVRISSRYDDKSEARKRRLLSADIRKIAPGEVE